MPQQYLHGLERHASHDQVIGEGVLVPATEWFPKILARGGTCVPLSEVARCRILAVVNREDFRDASPKPKWTQVLAARTYEQLVDRGHPVRAVWVAFDALGMSNSET